MAFDRMRSVFPTITVVQKNTSHKEYFVPQQGFSPHRFSTRIGKNKNRQRLAILSDQNKHFYWLDKADKRSIATLFHAGNKAPNNNTHPLPPTQPKAIRFRPQNSSALHEFCAKVPRFYLRFNNKPYLNRPLLSPDCKTRM
jgi:hypothetical protein